MRRLLTVIAAVALFLSPSLTGELFAQGGGGRGRGNAEPPPPAPRTPDGKITFSGEDGQVGIWTGAFGGFGTLSAPTPPGEQGGRGGRGGGDFTYDDVPLQDWALALYVDRQTHELEPHARCKASGIARQHQTPYGVEFVEFTDLKRIYLFDNGGPHTFRTIYLDGRNHPADEDLERNGYGHSIGWWEGDTLVVDTIGFDESFWLDRRGLPHTDQLRTLERFTRTNFRTIEYEVTFEDPGALTAPWTGSFNLSFSPGTELFEYICQQANYAHELMIGDQESVDRTATIVP
jgi:hypothetical protein